LSRHVKPDFFARVTHPGLPGKVGAGETAPADRRISIIKQCVARQFTKSFVMMAQRHLTQIFFPSAVSANRD
jgi:hypothetical protein